MGDYKDKIYEDRYTIYCKAVLEKQDRCSHQNVQPTNCNFITGKTTKATCMQCGKIFNFEG